MSKKIIITEKQYKMLENLNEDEFDYLSNSEFKPYDGYNNITADGKIDGTKPADKNTTADEHGKRLTMQGWNRYRTYGNIYPASVREGVEISNKEDNTADDFGEVDVTDDNRLENPNLVQIPNTVKQREKLLIDSISNLNDMQKAIVLNDLLPHLTSDSTTYHQQKKTDKNIEKSNFNVSKNTKRNLANNA